MKKGRKIRNPIYVNDGNYYLIPLTKGLFAKVCPCHIHLVAGVNWCASHGYAVRRIGTRENSYIARMHCVILGLEPGSEFEGDHIHSNRLDNRCSELRVCTHAENTQNVTLRTANKSGYKGVHWSASLERWCAQIQHKHIGVFDTAELAALAYNTKAYELFGEFAKLNIIPEKSEVLT